MSFSSGHVGGDVRNDCRVTLDPSGKGIEVRSSVAPLYGKRIEEVVGSALQEIGMSDCGVLVEDAGAFDFCIRARLEAAALAAGAKNPLALGESATSHPPDRHRHRRTRLYLPGNTPKYFINAGLHGSDAVILDLEDSVPADEKPEARSLVRHALAAVDFGRSERMVRVNSGNAGREDLEILLDAGVETVVVPKVERPEDLGFVPDHLGVVALIESARGVANALEIAQARPNVVALAFGVEDYLSDIGARERSAEALAYAFGATINAARAAGVQPLGPVWIDVDDPRSFAAEARRLAGLGFEGVGCLHPSQVPVAMRAFEPDEAQLESARRIVAEFEQAGGAVSVDGKMVDAPVAARARRVLAGAESTLPAWRLA